MLLLGVAVALAQTPVVRLEDGAKTPVVRLDDGAKTPMVQLNNGVEMPMISLGTWQYNLSVAFDVVKLGLSIGFTHIDTANDYRNQRAVGAALAARDRASYFLTTKIPPQTIEFGAYHRATKDLHDNLEQLNMSYVDLLLVHFPPPTNACGPMRETWRAVEDFYKAGKARAIGVSNYCISSLECLAKGWTVKPAVNQVKLHVGMGADPGGLLSYCRNLGTVVQAYSPLDNGQSHALINGSLVTGIGGDHGKSGAQVSLR